MMVIWCKCGLLRSSTFVTCHRIYAPTQDPGDEEIEKFYQEIRNGIKYAKSDEVICIMGDLNANVGDEKYQK